MLDIKALIANILEWIVGTNRYYSANWTATSSNASNIRLTDDMILPKGTYLIAVGSPYIQGATGLAGLQIGTTGDLTTFVSLPVNTYTRASYIVQLSSQQTVYLKTQSTASVTFANTERGSLKAVRLCG